MQRERVKTSQGMGDVRALMRSAFRAEFSRELPRKAEPYLLAMIALENGHGQSVYNNNFGNITVSSSSSPYYLVPGNPRLFGAFDAAPDGMRAFVKFFKSPTHARILAAAERGDFDAFFDGIVKPHPSTKMSYCPDCDRPDVRQTYQVLVRQYGGSGGRLSGSGFPWVLALPIGAAAYVWNVRRKKQ